MIATVMGMASCKCVAQASADAIDDRTRVAYVMTVIMHRICCAHRQAYSFMSSHHCFGSCCPADPLRVLRAVRFSTRFDFDLDPAILEAAASDEVRLRFPSGYSASPCICAWRTLLCMALHPSGIGSDPFHGFTINYSSSCWHRLFYVLQSLPFDTRLLYATHFFTSACAACDLLRSVL